MRLWDLAALEEARARSARRTGEEVGGRRYREGWAVAGASIVVTNANRSRPSGDDEVLGRAVSGPDGRFVLRDLPLPVLQPDPGPIPRPAEGKFEVAGTA